SELEALGRAVRLPVEGGGRLLKAAQEQDEDRLEAALAVEVVAEAPLDDGGRALEERARVQERRVANDARVRGALDAGSRARERERPEDGRADLAALVLVAAVRLHEEPLARAEVEVELDHSVEAVRGGGDVEVLDAAGGGEAARHEARDLRPVDVHAPGPLEL